MSYDVGDQIKVSALWTNADGEAADPTTVVFKSRSPSGEVTSLTFGQDAGLLKAATGSYYTFVALTEQGTWYVRFEGTGDIVAAAEQGVDVMPSVF